MKFITKIKEAFSMKAGLAVAAAGAVPMLSSTSAHAALSTEAAAMVSAAETAFTDLAGAVGTLGIGVVGVAIALVVVALVVAFVKSGGK